MVVASIRSKNPGAMWGRTGRRTSSDKFVQTNAPIPVKWGSKRTEYLSDGLGQGNNIAYFENNIDGICAQLDLWKSSAHYKNKPLAEALHTWSGGNSTEQYIDFVKDRVPGITRNTIMDDAFWRGPMGVAFLKAQAWHEAGQKYPASDAEFEEARRRVFGNEKRVATTKAATTSTVVIAAGGAAAQQAHAAGYHWGGVAAILAVSIAIGAMIFVFWRMQHKDVTS